ncbi:MAG TPA: galactokinase family protein, partial [Acidimicrobiales bacterium]|nr:galactokinase family protein [Acidimicrobiales bacterium]
MADRFRRLAGRAPAGVWQAPGRVNLLGEHTDYNAGLALPVAIERSTSVAVALRPDGRWRCWSTARPQEPADARLDEAGASLRGWARYVVGVAWALRRSGVELAGADVVVDSTVPAGAGLSSSAALTAAVAVALGELAGAPLDRSALVAACHEAEAGFVGAPTGTLDQRAVLEAAPGTALFLDFRDGAAEHVPAEAALPLVVVDTGIRHDHRSGDYGRRRRECEEAAAALGCDVLRQATLDAVAERLTGTLAARARHVLGENDRVGEAVRRLRAGAGIGDLLDHAHRSLRDDFEASCPEADAVVEAARAAGATGARLTGGGFGGSVLVTGLPEEAAVAAATRA